MKSITDRKFVYVIGRLHTICKTENCQSCPLAKIEDEESTGCLFGCVLEYLENLRKEIEETE